MSTIRVSATKARNTFFSLLDQVAAGKEVVIEKDKKIVAVLKSEKAFDWEKFMKAAKKAHGILKDYSVEEIAPTRRKGAWGNFGQWDKDIDFSKLQKKK